MTNTEIRNKLADEIRLIRRTARKYGDPHGYHAHAIFTVRNIGRYTFTKARDITALRVQVVA